MEKRTTRGGSAFWRGYRTYPVAAISTAAATIHQARRLDRFRSGRAGAGNSADAAPLNHASSSLRSRAVCQRTSRSLARHLRITRSTADGGEPTASGGGSNVSTAAIRLAESGLSKARSPVISSYSTAPKENRSVRASTSLPCNCSGDMYCSVPTMDPSFVSAWVTVSSPAGSRL